MKDAKILESTLESHMYLILVTYSTILWNIQVNTFYH